jgi:ribosomal protein L11 methyltransferase
MEYLQLTFTIAEGPEREMLIALLSEETFEGFEETQDTLVAIIAEPEYQAEAIKTLADAQNVSFSVQRIQQQNWNAQWESDFQPVIVPGFCTVRASFHPPATDTPYEIIITPKMSFGTGHHATTQLMMAQMQNLDIAGKKIFDFGTGTGILAILSKKLGAADVVAIDNDEWAVPNATENALMNGTTLRISQGSIEDIPEDSYDIILANINRNILLEYMDRLKQQTKKGGHLLLSGILEEDQPAITTAAGDNGFVVVNERILNGWMAILFVKQ